jgi:hypothetical protein
VYRDAALESNEHGRRTRQELAEASVGIIVRFGRKD